MSQIYSFKPSKSKMSIPRDHSERALLYDDMASEAKRIGDIQLLMMVRKRLDEMQNSFTRLDCGNEVIQFPGSRRINSNQVQKSKPIWCILLQSAMIPAGMAAILFAFVHASIHLYCIPIK